ncbi:MAG: zinc-binding dehydrogenase [Pirellulales bacterium]
MLGRAAVFHGPDQPLELREFAVPELRAGELLVQVLACNLCRSDLHSHAGRRTVATPTILGHEIVGRIAAFGPETSQIDMTGVPAAVGDRITWSIIVGCGDCFFCHHDLPQKCRRLYKYGHEPIDSERCLGGGLADYILLKPGTAWLRLPDSVPNGVAALANCAAATAAAALRDAGGANGQRVVILGAGVLGTLAVAMARADGADTVMVIDPDEERRKRARAFGATHSVDPADGAPEREVLAATDGIGADTVLELAGTAASVEAGVKLVRTGGTVILAGTVAPCGNVALDPEYVVRRMITIRGVHNYAPGDLAAAVEFLVAASGTAPLASLLGREISFDAVEKAFALAHRSPGTRTTVEF